MGPEVHLSGESEVVGATLTPYMLEAAAARILYSRSVLWRNVYSKRTSSEFLLANCSLYVELQTCLRPTARCTIYAMCTSIVWRRHLYDTHTSRCVRYMCYVSRLRASPARRVHTRARLRVARTRVAQAPWQRGARPLWATAPAARWCLRPPLRFSRLKSTR